MSADMSDSVKQKKPIQCPLFLSGVFHFIQESISRGEVHKRRLSTLIFAGWLPPDIASSWSCLCLYAGVRQYAYPIADNEGSPDRDLALCRYPEWLYYAAASTSFAMAHIKAANSRAMATATTCAGFFLAIILL